VALSVVLARLQARSHGGRARVGPPRPQPGLTGRSARIVPCPPAVHVGRRRRARSRSEPIGPVELETGAQEAVERPARPEAAGTLALAPGHGARRVRVLACARRA